MGLLISLVDASSIDVKTKKILREFARKIEFLETKQVTKDEFEAFRRETNENFRRVWEAIEKLTEAQKRTEERLTKLTERVDALAQAQQRTEEEIAKLSKSLRETNKMVGGISDAIGYPLEDRAIAGLPSILKERFRIQVEGRLRRKYVFHDLQEEEVNIFGRGKRDGKEVCIIGEGKARLSKKDVDRFAKKIDRLQRHKVIEEEAFPLFVTYTVKPAVEKYAQEKDFYVFWSYEFS